MYESLGKHLRRQEILGLAGAFSEFCDEVKNFYNMMQENTKILYTHTPNLNIRPKAVFEPPLSLK